MADRVLDDTECLTILDSFRKENIHLYSDPNFTGASVRLEKNDVFLAAYSLSGKVPLSGTYKLQYSYRGITEKLEIIQEQRNTFSGLGGFKDGSSVLDPASMYNGTGGWSFFLNLGGGFMPLVCISNWHVFCQVAGNSTSIGIPINLDSFNATLFSYNNVYENELNDWDFALARYENISDCAKAMRACNDGTIHPHPTSLSTNVKLGDGATYRKIGSGISGNICAEGKLLEFADFPTHFTIGPGIGTKRRYWLKNQLIFDDIGSPGDSGSVVVRTSDNTVTGLLSSSDPGTGTGKMAANRLYARQWKVIGTFKDKDYTLPIFDAPDIAELAKREFPHQLLRGGLEQAKDNPSARDLPIFPPTRNYPALYMDKSHGIAFGRYIPIGTRICYVLNYPLPAIIEGETRASSMPWVSERVVNNVGGGDNLKYIYLGHNQTFGIYLVLEPAG